jgi:hypothetical protein
LYLCINWLIFIWTRTIGQGCEVNFGFIVLDCAEGTYTYVHKQFSGKCETYTYIYIYICKFTRLNWYFAVTIGKKALIAPSVHIYAATHPVCPKERLDFELARPVKVLLQIYNAVFSVWWESTSTSTYMRFLTDWGLLLDRRPCHNLPRRHHRRWGHYWSRECGDEGRPLPCRCCWEPCKDSSVPTRLQGREP